jgi:NADP-dependent 3-hydroxy acid dehydrogenase YdfG
MDVKDKVVIITGASAGIGKSAAKQLSELGCRLVLNARRKEKLEELAERLNLSDEKIAIVQGDVGNPTTAEAARNEALNRFARIDALVNNAGWGVFKPIHELSHEEWEGMIQTNLNGAFYMTKAVLPTMIEAKSGTIVNVSSVAGSRSFPNGSAYCASKFGMEAMSGSMVEELREHGVRVSLICPGAVGSEFFDNPTGMDAEKYSDTSWMVTPDQIAEAIVRSITCDENSFIERQTIRPLQPPR